MFVTGKSLYSQYRNREENTKETEDLFLYRRIFVKSVFVSTIFDCTRKDRLETIELPQGRTSMRNSEGDSLGCPYVNTVRVGVDLGGNFGIQIVTKINDQTWQKAGR